MKKVALSLLILVICLAATQAQEPQVPSWGPLEQQLKQAKNTFENARIEYQKIKSVSRDWDRRNEAEETFYGAYETFTQAQDKLFEAKIEDFQNRLNRSPAAHSASGNLSNGFIWLVLMALFFIPISLIFSDLFKSFIGFCVIKRSIGFKTADRIEIGSTKGDVVNIGTFQTTLLEVTIQDGQEKHTDKIIHLPNHLLLKEPLHVQSKK